MRITIVLSTGKKLELTPEELDELRRPMYPAPGYTPLNPQYAPVYPYVPPYPRPPFEVTC